MPKSKMLQKFKKSKNQLKNNEKIEKCCQGQKNLEEFWKMLQHLENTKVKLLQNFEKSENVEKVEIYLKILKCRTTPPPYEL